MLASEAIGDGPEYRYGGAVILSSRLTGDGQAMKASSDEYALEKPAVEHDVVVAFAEVADDAVAAPPVGAEFLAASLADHAEAVPVVDVQDGVIGPGQGGQLGQPGRVAGHAVDAVGADQPGAARVLAQQPLQVVGVVMGEPFQGRPAGPGDHRAVVDRLVGPGVQQDGAAAGQDRNDGGVDMGEGGQQ